MKLIIVEAGDRLGKNTLIERLLNYYNFDNVSVRHFGKPPKQLPKGLKPFEYQAQCFLNEGHLLNIMDAADSEFCYYPNVVIWNRSHIGEYVYGTMFRGESKERVADFIKSYESNFIRRIKDVTLITLTADPEFFLHQEDGQSFSKNLEDKTKELELFKEAFELSSIPKKTIIRVNEGHSYVPKDYVFNTAINLINS